MYACMHAREAFFINLLVMLCLCTGSRGTGESGLGKSTFVNTLFAADIFQNTLISDQPGASAAHNPCIMQDIDKRVAARLPPTVGVHRATVVLEEGNLQLRLTIVDTPGFGGQLNNDKWCGYDISIVCGVIASDVSAGSRSCSTSTRRTRSTLTTSRASTARPSLTPACTVCCTLSSRLDTGVCRVACAAPRVTLSSRLKELDTLALKALAAKVDTPIDTCVPV